MTSKEKGENRRGRIAKKIHSAGSVMKKAKICGKRNRNIVANLQCPEKVKDVVEICKTKMKATEENSY